MADQPPPKPSLPAAEPPFAGVINELATDSTPSRPEIKVPPAGAPNVIVVMYDDVGFHTTALCSPTRAALLTGRNHHSAHMGGISEIAYGFPGYDGIIPKSTATVAEILRQNGYSTAMFGKAHVTPMWETSPAGPFDRWPTGLGFERFYGFLGGEASQWEPALYDQTTVIIEVHPRAQPARAPLRAGGPDAVGVWPIDMGDPRAGLMLVVGEDHDGGLLADDPAEHGELAVLARHRGLASGEPDLRRDEVGARHGARLI